MSKLNTTLKADLIYDVGMHCGEDTEYYLQGGFRVLAIEADPHLVNRARQRFSREIETRQLTILNLGISSQTSVEKFWICESNSNWNSFDRSVASRDGSPHHAIDVRVQRFDDILREFGSPIYLKIDIEGRDALCLEGLQHAPIPTFISAEDQGPDPRTGIPWVLAMMNSLGYRYFNLVSQQDFRPLFRRHRRSYQPNLLERVAESAAYGRLRVPAICKLVQPITHKAVLARRNSGHKFPFGSSGPWGKGIPGGWVTFGEACQLQGSIRAAHFANPKVNPWSFWCDWHATTERPTAH
jgi:FkbM family methyltransferase